jgi:hypothetical protein
MPMGLKTLAISPPQAAHVVMGSSLIRWTTSICCSQLEHL